VTQPISQPPNPHTTGDLWKLSLNSLNGLTNRGSSDGSVMSKPKKKGLKKVREIAQREIEEEDTELVGALGVGRHGRPP